MMAEAQREGRRIASRYHLLEPIGRGGMGIVWRAHDELLDREVAVKEVRYADMLGEDNQEDFNRRTKREARAAGRLTHPNVVVVHDVVEEDGRPWIVMQLVESRSLGKVLRQDGPLPPERVAEIVEGEPEAREHLDLRWLTANELYDVEWLPADLPIVRAVQGRLDEG